MQERFAVRITEVEFFHRSALSGKGIQTTNLVQDSAAVWMYCDAGTPRGCYNALVQKNIIDLSFFQRVGECQASNTSPNNDDLERSVLDNRCLYRYRHDK